MFWGCTSVCAFIHYLRLCAGILEWLVINFSCIYKKLMAVDEYAYNLLCLKKNSCRLFNMSHGISCLYDLDWIGCASHFYFSSFCSLSVPVSIFRFLVHIMHYFVLYLKN